MSARHPVALGPEARRRWDTDGWCVVDGVLPPDAVDRARHELPELFPTAEEFADDVDPERNRPFRSRADVFPRFPFDADGIDALVAHDALLDLAEFFLGTADLRMYQAMASAKYSDGAPDYEQMLHVDYANHTLAVPRHDAGYQQLELFVYLSDVTAERAATRMVSRRLTTDIPVERTYLAPERYAELYAAEEPATGPAGAILVYRPDVYHRGVALAAARSARYMLHVAYCRRGLDWLGFQAWPAEAERMAWYRYVAHAGVRQLTAIGFPPPGDPYWTDETLAGVAARYPFLDMAPWRGPAGG